MKALHEFLSRVAISYVFKFQEGSVNVEINNGELIVLAVFAGILIWRAI